MLAVVTVNFLNGFFLMNMLWVPPRNWMVVYRLIVWVLLGNFTFREQWANLCGEKPSGTSLLSPLTFKARRGSL